MKKNLYQFLLIIYLLCVGASLPLKKRLKSHRKLDDFKNAQLTFVKTYDLSYVDGYWKFKIQVRGDEELSNGDKLKQDIALSDGPYEFSGYSECTFNDHILDCGAGDQSGKNDYLLRISTPKSAGTIFWNYPGERTIFFGTFKSFTYIPKCLWCFFLR